MEKEQKYSVVGRVEIGTDEYRDLIENCMRLEKESSENRSKYWAEQTKASEAQKETKIWKEKVSEYQDFIIDENLEKKFKEYRLAKLDEQNEDD